MRTAAVPHASPEAGSGGGPFGAAFDRLREAVGGAARLRVIVLLACVLALNTADSSTIGAVATELERSLRIGNTQVGLLVTASTGVGALASLPIGVLADRVNRVRLLSTGIIAWSFALALTGASTSFAMLLITRLVLGGFVAIAGPVVASLVGDLFPAVERGRVYGYILAGELVGTGFGFLVPGTVAGVLDWRWAFFVLAVPGVALAAAVSRLLPEPARGGQSRLLPEGQHGAAGTPEADLPGDEVVEQVRERGVAPSPSGVVTRSGPGLSARDAIRLIVRIRTNNVLIVASALGYFFLSGLQTFAVAYLRGRFGLGQSVASILLVVVGAGALGGVLVAGRAADGLIHRRVTAGRVIIGGCCFLAAAAAFAPGLLLATLWLAAPCFVLGAAALGGTNPPLDAARLDIVPSALWGRAESVRTLLRSGLTAVAPVLFGWVSGLFGSGNSGFGADGVGSQAGASGLGRTFLVMLAPLALAGVVALLADRTYLTDVATAARSDELARAARDPADT